MNNLNPILDHRDIINQNIAKGFIGTALMVMETPDNPIPGHRQFVADNVMKGHGGEGSHGGHIIGHTKSGKPIYESGKTGMGEHTEQDHRDAGKVHANLAKEYHEDVENAHDFKGEKASKKQQHHLGMAQFHNRAADVKRANESGKKAMGKSDKATKFDESQGKTGKAAKTTIEEDLKDHKNIKKSQDDDDDTNTGKTLIFTPEAITKFTDDLTKAFEAGEIGVDEIEKGMKDLSKLTKKTMTDKNGNQRTVYVLTNKPEHKEYNPNGVMQKKDISDEELHQVAEHVDKLSHINKVRFEKLHTGDKKFPEASAKHDKAMAETSKPPVKKKTSSHPLQDRIPSDAGNITKTSYRGGDVKGFHHYEIDTDKGNEYKVRVDEGRHNKVMKYAGVSKDEKKTVDTIKMDEKKVERYKKFMAGHDDSALKTALSSDVPEQAEAAKQMTSAKKSGAFSEKPDFKAAGGGEVHIVAYSKEGVKGTMKKFEDVETAKKFKGVMERSGYHTAYMRKKPSEITSSYKFEKSESDELNPQELDDLRKGEIMDKIGMGYGGSNALTFTKTGKELKTILPVTIAALSVKKGALEALMAIYIKAACAEPTEIYQSYQVKSIACKRYSYELMDNYDKIGEKSTEPTEEQKAMRQYNDACYAWQSLSEDIAVCAIIGKNLDESKKYTLSVSQIIALNLGLISESM